MNSKTSSLNVVEAQYSKQGVDRFRGNPLIEALPSLESILHSIRARSHAGTSKEPGNDVTFVAETMSHFFQSSYDSRARATGSRSRRASLVPADVPPIVELRGKQKTDIAHRLLSLYPRAINHSASQIYQLPYLHIKATHNLSSPLGLARALLKDIDKLTANGGHYQRSLETRRYTTDATAQLCAQALVANYVGILVVDDAHFLQIDGASSWSAMATLTTISRATGLPIVLLSSRTRPMSSAIDFRQSRRQANAML
jgi:hypothetical protein